MGKKRTEGDLVTAVLSYLSLRGIPATRHHAGEIHRQGLHMHLGSPGWPDIIAVLPPTGRLLGVECKAEKGKQSPSQVAMGERIEEAGGLYVVVRTVQELDEYLLFGKEPANEAHGNAD